MEFNKGVAGLNSVAEQKEKLRVALIIRDRPRRLPRSGKKTVALSELLPSQE